MNLSKKHNKTRLLDDYQQDLPELTYPREYYGSSGVLVPKRKFKMLKSLPSKFASNTPKIVKFGYLLKRCSQKKKTLRFVCI